MDSTMDTALRLPTKLAIGIFPNQRFTAQFNFERTVSVLPVIPLKLKPQQRIELVAFVDE